MNSINKIKEPTLAIEGRITIRLFTSTLRFLFVRISLKTRMIRIALIIVRTVMTELLSLSEETKSSKTMEMSAATTMKKSKRFQLF